MLGALSDYDESEAVSYAEMPELERYMLHRLAQLDEEMTRLVEAPSTPI